jgi:6,7-dimethyl-8-ribityllumazine synthase
MVRSGSQAQHPFQPGAASGFRFAIVFSRFNESITSSLLAAAVRTLRDYGAGDSIDQFAVPGAYEIPFAAMQAAKTGRYDAIIGLGCVIRGETPHFEYICQWTAHGIGRVGLETGVPAVFGVLTTDTLEQAAARSSDPADNKGAEAARCAIELATLARRMEVDDRGNG